MSKVYEVEVPAHSGGNKFRVVASSEKRVKEMLCKKLGRNRVPKGTVIKKVGLAKKKETLESESETEDEVKKESEVSLKERAKQASERASAQKKKTKPIKALNPHEKKLYLERKKEEREEKEKENCACVSGLYLNYDDQVKLKSKMDFSGATLYIEDDGKVSLCYVGDECILTVTRGKKLWLYMDHTEDKVNEKELLNHI